MRSATGLAKEVADLIVQRRRTMLVFHLFFSVLAAAILLPAASGIASLVLTRTGRLAITNNELVTFLVSPAGLLWILIAGTLFACIAFIQHAGLMVIASNPRVGPYRDTITALVHVGHKLPQLLKLAAMQVAAHLLLAAPFILAIAALFSWLLGGYDIYYVIREKPAAYWYFLLACLPCLLAIILVNGGLYVRWLLALPELMLAHVKPRRALIQSHRLTHGWRNRIAAKAVSMALVVASLPLLLAFLFDHIGVWFLGILPERLGVLIPATIFLLTIYIALAFIVSFFGVNANSMLIYRLYERAGGREHAPLPATHPRQASLLSWSAEIILLLFALGQSIYVLNGFEFRDDIIVIAHRGSSINAPENTRAAMELAISEGAHMLETDLRLTADGTPVLLHDQDLRRVAGIARSISEIRDHELANIDAGHRHSAHYAGEPVLTLEELVSLSRGRAGLLLELKEGARVDELLRSTVTILQEANALDGTMIGAMQAELLQKAKKLEPELGTVLFIHTGIGSPSRLEFDALGLRAANVSSDNVVDARRRGYRLFVWTVNDRESMARFIDMGVDGIITDRPDVLAELIAERAALTDAERLVLKLRHWLRS